MIYRLLGIVMLIGLPLLWGLGVDWLFGRIARRRAAANPATEDAEA